MSVSGTFALQQQQAGDWCWLAVAASVADYFAGQTGSHRQCVLAQALISVPSGTQCCSNPTPVPCDQQGFPSHALGHLNHANGSQSQLAPFATIANEIATLRPVAVALRYTGSGVDHVIAVTDAVVQNGQQLLEIDDPASAALPGSRPTVRYGASTYRNASISWLRTYFTRP
jgi:hypothetical protein